VYKITRTSTFVKTVKKFFQKHPHLREKFKDVIFKLQENPFEPGLKTHKLKGKLKEKYGISLDYKYRITAAIQIAEKEVILMDVGPHDAVY
jgi:mRNA-degrading endonuclease YafQ of YafQ-DinJ toxin-antitoxin module